ncbi:hypothetical protein U3A58_08760 [Algoriphagus sp. C2-6-M1]|uniref:hypothetical protein n=1 Tax=Algoriphagus persicinus TaxID=3108754 RepID=UPI002B3B671C|nr:hypothetical protein [Algoriphagus sp. C2-6-M1]MEB2780482.1 hypothetical protein [Algoriphagus sp. C2-6-M1]
MDHYIFKPIREYAPFVTSKVDTPVVFSGGECTIHSQIIPFARAVKAMGFGEIEFYFFNIKKNRPKSLGPIVRSCEEELLNNSTHVQT